MLVVRVGLGLTLAYLALLLLAWLFQDRLAFPAPAGPVPDPRHVRVPNGERIELISKDGTRLAGWYLHPKTDRPRPSLTAPGLLWFYGNGENIATIWPVVRAFQPPGAALLVIDYPGYGGSEGRATEQAIFAAADAAYDALARRPEVARIYVYGRSLGAAVAIHTAASHPTAGLILEAPFTSATDMARLHYRMVPRALLHLRLDNVATIRQVRCPVLIFHGTADRVVPIAMGRKVAAAAPGPVELVPIPGSDHNDTYDIGGAAYRDRLARFVSRP
jgi:hypothetical protein